MTLAERKEWERLFRIKSDAFLVELSALTRKHGIMIDGCSCCSSPFLRETIQREGKYISSYNGGHVTYAREDGSEYGIDDHDLSKS